MTAALTGFWLGFSLILPIGAQNAFLLRQGLRQEHVFWACLTCAVSDALLITAGVASFSYVIESAPWIAPVMRWAGAAFLFVYGALALRSAFNGSGALTAASGQGKPLKATILTLLAITWLNPHVYLDTVLLIGSVSTRYPGEELFFGAGAVVSSFVFFFALGYGARLLTPFFAKPASWRILDALICAIMWAIALGLVLHV